VSHDLRAPLRAISGFSTILKEDYAGKLDEEANRITDKIISNAKMMGQLIDDLISFSQIERKEKKHQPVDMKNLAESCLAELLQHNPENKYRLHIHPLPACYADEGLIKQVWINLLGNALKYSSKKTNPVIEIGTQEDTGRQCYFIRDNGVGFDMQYVHKLFGVFQRLHNQVEFEGTGVGLALAKRIINHHNGDIWAEGSPGNGATFYFSLPENNMP
ncbi:MAG TPA: ATP-binding protein, partial [Chitinophagaceae bacterium]|nr:ATP-binding protein [Chitinophagaceae bacterium]